MEWIDNLKSAVKLLLSFGIVLVLALALGAGALWSMARINTASGQLSSNALPGGGR